MGKFFAKIKIQNTDYYLLALLYLAFGIGIFAPLFSDEISLRMIYSRLFYDDGNSFFCLAQCFSANWKIAVSIFNWPYHALESVFYNQFETPLIIRIASICKGWLIIFLFYSIARRVTKQNNFSIAMCLCIFGLGVAPLIFVFNRPEQEVFLVIMSDLLLLFYVTERPKNYDLLTNLFFLAIHASLLLIAYSAHPNAMYFSPLFLFIGWNILTLYGIRFLSIFILILFFLDTANQGALIYNCPNDALVRFYIQKFFSVDPKLIVNDFRAAFSDIIVNIKRTPVYFQNFAFSDDYPYNWAPNHRFLLWHQVSNFLSYIALGLVALAAIAGSATSIFRLFKRQNLELYSKIGLILVFCIVPLLCLQIAKNWYSSALVLPIVGLSAILSLVQWYKLVPLNGLKIWINFTRIVAGLSMLLYLWTFLIDSPPHFDTLSEPLFLFKDTPQANLSFSGFNYSQTSEKIWAAAALCGFSKEKTYKRLAVDDVTYWTLRKFKDPLLLFYLNRLYGASTDSDSYRASLGTLENFLRSRQSDGIIARCDEVIEPALRKKARQLGSFCCWKFNR